MSDTKSASDTLIVYRGWLDPGRHVWSPFVIKLEARLRFAGVPYRAEVGSTMKAPSGKIPYVELPPGLNSSAHTDSDAGPAFLGDSTLIIKGLVERGVLPDINAGLTPALQAQDLALRALLEDKLYFYHTRERWTENYYTMRDHILSALSYPLRVAIGFMIHRNTVKTLHGQGTGRYSPEEIRLFRREIWENVNALLSSARNAAKDARQPFWVLGGEGPTEADASLFGFIVSVLVCTACPESQSVVKGFPVLLDYAGRVHDAYYPDYERWKE